MTTSSSSSNIFYSGSSSAQQNGAKIMDSSASRMALDNLIRRELKVSDPNDAKQVAEALLNRYKNNPRAISISREAEGVPFLLAPEAPTAVAHTTTASDTELQQAINHVNRDLDALTSSSILKQNTTELEDWATAIRTAIQEGVTAARMAFDTRQRDKTFGIRRSLGDHARVARFMGTYTPAMTIYYRKLAQSLDEVAAVLLVIMGETLSKLGSNGEIILQVPYSELQQRRDAVIYALRNFVGTTQTAFDQNTWPRGLVDYAELLDKLDRQGNGDLRALLTENELARVMDLLIQRIGQGNASGLKALGATAQLDIERLRRLVVVARNTLEEESSSAAFSTFLAALKLFIDSFKSAGGFQLPTIARPAILTYGLYSDSADSQHLIQLTNSRNFLASKLDNFITNNTSQAVQVALDKILYDADRMIDLFASATAQGDSETKSQIAAHASSIKTFIEKLTKELKLESESEISKAINEVSRIIISSSNYADSKATATSQDLKIRNNQEESWIESVSYLVPADELKKIRELTCVEDKEDQVIKGYKDKVSIPKDMVVTLGDVLQELNTHQNKTAVSNPGTTIGNSSSPRPQLTGNPDISQPVASKSQIPYQSSPQISSSSKNQTNNITELKVSEEDRDKLNENTSFAEKQSTDSIFKSDSVQQSNTGIVAESIPSESISVSREKLDIGLNLINNYSGSVDLKGLKKTLENIKENPENKYLISETELRSIHEVIKSLENKYPMAATGYARKIGGIFK